MHSLPFYLLTIFCYKYLQLPAVSEAKTPTNGFTVDLIHRYSLKSPFYNSSMTHQERYQGMALHSSSRRYQYKLLEENNTETSIIPSNGDYLMKISIGVPPVDLFVIADTSSDLIWVQCKPCGNCNAQSTTIFDPNQSSSFETVPCDSPYCPNIPEMQCDPLANECQYWHTYGNGSSLTSGVMAKDMLNFGSTDNHMKDIKSPFVFGCGFEQDEHLDRGVAGYVGLSGGPFSLITQLGISTKFSYCLTPSNSDFTSKLRLGSHAVAEQDAVTTPLSTRYFPNLYVITLRGISIAGQMRVKMERDIFIDSSSTLTYLDPSAYQILEEALKESIAVKPMPKSPQQDLSLCYDKQSGFISPPNMIFHLNGGDINLNTTNTFIDLGDFVCLAIVPSEEDGDPMIFGNVAQMNLEVEYDLQSKTVSFTPRTCASN